MLFCIHGFIASFFKKARTHRVCPAVSGEGGEPPFRSTVSVAQGRTLLKRRRGGTAKIGVFHKKERTFCTAFTTGRWQLRRAFTSTRALRGERAGPPQRHCQAALFNWRFPQGEGVEGKGAGGQLCAVGSPQRARREVTWANGRPRTCTGCGRVKTVCRVPSGNFYSARPRREPGLVENDSKKIFFRSTPPTQGATFHDRSRHSLRRYFDLRTRAGCDPRQG